MQITACEAFSTVSVFHIWTNSVNFVHCFNMSGWLCMGVAELKQ